MQVSPTLDLVRDYSRFVISFFEVISVSAPHIYHSALLLSPQTSITRRLYEQYASPVARVVHGLPELWKPISASVNVVDFEGYTTWSPCGKFIAIAKQGSAEILDAVTLKLLKTFKSPPDFRISGLSFTPDGRFLTQFGSVALISWDVQTGGPLTAVASGSSWFPRDTFSLTYSTDGDMIAVAYKCLPQDRHHCSALITIFDLFGTHIHTCHAPEERIISKIWAHGQCFRFATIKLSSIAIWEVAFTSPHQLTQVESLPAPDEIIEGKLLLFLPTLSRLAFILKRKIQIWDAKSSKLLLKPDASPDFNFYRTYTPYRSWGSFSLNGHLFACIADGGVYVWKESPSGYILHQKFAFILPFNSMGPCLSPDGESIITPLGSTIHLWPTRDQILPLFDTSTGDNVKGDSILAFSPNESFAAFTRGSVVKILDLRSGDLLSATGTDMKILCLWMTKNTVVAVVDRTIVSWKIPGENCGVKSEANFKDSVQILTGDHSSIRHISVSPDLRWIAASRQYYQDYLDVYDVFTGRCLRSTKTDPSWVVPKFTLDGRQIRDVGDYSGRGRTWDIVGDNKSGAINLVPKPLGRILDPPGLFPFQSSRGYEVTDDGWVLSPTQKRLLWVPQRWRSTQLRYRTWSGRFLGIFSPGLSDPVILEFFE